MSSDSQAHYELQVQQLRSNLHASEEELTVAKRDAEQARQLIIALGERFAPEVFARLLSSSGSKGRLPTEQDQRMRQLNLNAFMQLAEHLVKTISVNETLKTMSVPAIVALIGDALEAKLAQLLAFSKGLNAEQQRLVIEYVLGTAPVDWLSDPRFAEARNELETARRAQQAAEHTAREASERASRMALLQAESARETVRLREEIRMLQEQLLRRTEKAAAPLSPEPAPLSIHSPVTRVHAPSNGHRMDERSSATSQSQVGLPTTEHCPMAPLTQTTAVPTKILATDPMDLLITVLATRGICERPRLMEILWSEFNVGSRSDPLLANAAFSNAQEYTPRLIEPLMTRPEAGLGRTPYLYRLTSAGIEYARTHLQVEPVPSELTRLLDKHQSSKEHVALILLTRALFLDKYPTPIETVELFPTPIDLPEGKRSEPDLVVVLQDGAHLLIECERDTIKHPTSRTDKWDKYFRATNGNFYIVCPDAKSVQALMSEITQWQYRHGGAVRLRLTSILQASAPGAEFWSCERQLGSRA